MRPVVQPRDWRRDWTDAGPPDEEWAVDFPPGADERDIAAAGVAGRCFVRTRTRIPRHGAGAELRIALAKCDRYLAAPAAGAFVRWRWVPGAVLPCGRLVVVARDDEFLAGVLASRWLEVWCRGNGGASAVAGARSLPLPWAADTARGSLSDEQEERRAAVVRAWRAGGDGVADIPPETCAAEELDAAVAAAYGWPAGVDEPEALARLRQAAAPVTIGG